MARLVWLRKRLSVMSAGEIAYRIRYAAGDGLMQAAERLQFARRRALPVVLLGSRFLQSREPQVFWPQCRVDAGDARRLLAGEVPVFGQWIPVRCESDFWHTDPLFHVRWPRVPYRQIDYRPGNPTGDVRVVWELNRLQHLFGLALIAHEQPDLREAAVGLLERDLHAWHAGNPPFVGVNYISAMEEALRLIGLFHAYDLVRNWVSPATRALVAEIAAHHTRHIERRLSLYSSAGNHTIAEATGLLYAGVLLPELPGAAIWRQTGRRLLVTEAARQIDADGGCIEQATWYLLFITDLLGLAQALLAHAGEPAEPVIDAAVARSRGFLSALATGPEDLPRIGDADDGYALSPGLRISWQPASKGPVLRSFRTAGLSLVRYGGDDRLLFLHNPLGMAPGFGHGHADCLSVVFRWGGADLLIDPGTYLYGGAAGHRQYFRSAAGHNTATVDGADQAEQAGAFLWAKPYQAELLVSRFEGDCVWLLAQHDAFRDRGVTHYRGLIYRQDRYLAVWDHFHGAAGHDVALHWHLGCAPGTRYLPAGRVQLQLGEGREAQLEIAGGSVKLVEGSPAPLLGWRSTRYGNLEPSTVLEVRPDTAGVRRVITVLWLGEADELASLEPLFRVFERQAGT